MEKCFDLTLSEGIVFRATLSNSLVCKFGNSLLNHVELHLAPNDVRAAFPMNSPNLVEDMEQAGWPVMYAEQPSTQDVELAVNQLLAEIEAL